METRIGRVTHFYNRIGVAVLELEDTLILGDKIRLVGHSTEFEQVIESMEINHVKVDEAGPGEVALKVWEYVRRGDEVYKISE